MTTHLRARALQAGAFLALVGGMLAAVPSAAQAVDPTVQITGVSSADIPAGGKTTIEFRVTNKNLATPSAAHTVKVVVSAADMACSGSCGEFDKEIAAGGGSETFSATLTHTGSVPAGETKTVTIQISASIDDPVAGGSGGASRTIKIRGEDKPQTVRLVSGKVKDQDGKAVSGATVALRDSKGAEYDTVSNGNGGYSFTSSASKPIAVGALIVGATKTGYEVGSVTANGVADKSVTIPLTIKLKNVPTSATPSVTASISAPPTEDVTSDDTPAAEDTPAAADTTKTSGEDDSGSMLYIILGVLLVAAGVGAIVLVLMRRKSEGDDDGDGAKSGPVPSSPGGYAGADQTRLAAPVGGRGNDATMIAPRSGAPSMADAPTMIHQTGPVAAPADEFPDPYGAPMPQNGGAWGNAGGAAAAGAAAAGTYGAAQANGAYGAPTQFGAPPVPAQGGYQEQNANEYDAYGAAQDNGYGDQGGYDQAAGAYGDYGTPEQEQRYDEPTGMYRPEANGGYPQEAGYGDQGGYGAEQPAYGQNDGYGEGQDEYAAQGHNGAYQAGGYQGGTYGAAESADQGGYDSWDGQGGGIDNGNAYGPPAGDGTYGGGTYGGAQGGGNYGAAAPAPAGGNYGAAAPAPAGGNYGAAAPAPAGGNYGAPAPAPAAGAYGAPAVPGQTGGNYGAPAPASGGNYGAAAPASGGNYGAAAPAPAGTYGAPAGGGTYGGPAGGGNYGAPAGGGNYGAPAGGGYDEQQGGGPANGYGGDQGGYDPHAAYGGQANGYPQQGPPQQGGYPEQGGYGGEQQGGYYGGPEQQQGGRHGGQPRQQPPEPAQRRQLDWLDD